MPMMQCDYDYIMAPQRGRYVVVRMYDECEMGQVMGEPRLLLHNTDDLRAVLFRMLVYTNGGISENALGDNLGLTTVG